MIEGSCELKQSRPWGLAASLMPKFMIVRKVCFLMLGRIQRSGGS